MLTEIKIKNIRKGPVGKMPRKNAVVDRTRCVACGECAYVCPKGAVSVEKGCYALVDTSMCLGCGICSRSCPAGCITVEERKEALSTEEKRSGTEEI